MKIAFITFEYPPEKIGGAGVYAHNLVQGLRELGHAVTVFTPSRNNNNVVYIEESIKRVKIRNNIPMKAVQFWINIPDYIRKAHTSEPFDLIHFNGASYWFIPNRIIDVPHIITVHHSCKDAFGEGISSSSIRHLIFGESNFAYRTLEKRILHYADGIIAVSEYTRDRIQSLYKVAKDKTAIVLNGFEIPDFKLDSRSKGKIRDSFNLDSRPILLFVGRIDDPRKGLSYLLDAFKIVSEKFDLQLLIVGNGEDTSAFNQIQSLGIGEKTRIAGFVDSKKLAECYSVCDLYVCPSLMEGFGFTILEAMTFGKKIVATDVGAISEISGPGVYLTTPKNPIAMANTIIHALEQPPPNSEDIIVHLSKFNWSRVAEQTISVYKSFLQK